MVGVPGTVDQCWSVTQTTSNPRWHVDAGGTGSFGTGPSAANSGSNYLYLETSGGVAGSTAYLNLPAMDLTPLTVPYFSFYYHMFGATMGDLIVEASLDTGATWTAVLTKSGQDQTANADPYKPEFVNMAAFKSAFTLIRFRGVRGTSFTGDMAIDDVRMEEAPACPSPSNLSVPTTTSTTAIVNWSDPSASSWDLEWGPIGFTQGTGSIKTASSIPDTLTGLAPNTEYEVYVRTNCVAGGNGFSIWIGPIYFRTQCSAFTAPYTNNFDAEANNTTPICWSSIASYGNNNAWVRATTTWSPANSGTQHLGLYNQTGFTATDTLGAISPEFSDLTAGDKRIAFYAKSTEITAKLLVGTTDGSNINILDTVTFSSVNSYNFYIVNLTTAAGYNGTDKYVFMGYDLASALTFDYILIDDFNYETAPACNPPAPNTLGAIPGITTATVFWGSGSSGDATEVQWGTPNFM